MSIAVYVQWRSFTLISAIKMFRQSFSRSRQNCREEPFFSSPPWASIKMFFIVIAYPTLSKTLAVEHPIRFNRRILHLKNLTAMNLLIYKEERGSSCIGAEIIS